MTGVHDIVHFGYSYNPATMKQREDRLHRFGQSFPVNVFSPYLTNTIDQGIREIFLKRKENTQEFDDMSYKMSEVRLSKEDFIKLIGLY